MRRARPVDAALAALATLAVVLPVTTLFEPLTFLRPALFTIVTVAVVGVVVRRLQSLRWPVPVVQLLAAFLATSWMHGRGHLWYGLPTLDMLRGWRGLLNGAMQVVQGYSAPAPATRGVILGITLVVGLTAVVVDLLAVTLRSPAVAGLALLTAYLMSATNSGVGLAVGFFLLAAGFWIVLVGRQGTSLFRGWGTPIPLDGAERRTSEHALAMRVSSAGRRLGAGSLALAVLLPMVLPHFPERFLLAGLGRSDDGFGHGGTSRLNSTLDISRSLASQSEGEVLTYRSNAPVTDPLRVDVLDTYSRGNWTSPASEGAASLTLTDPPAGMSESVTRTHIRIVVSGNRIEPPQLAAPYPSVGADLGDVSWAATGTGSIRPEGRTKDYTVEYVKALPTETQLQDSRFVSGGTDVSVTPDDLYLDPDSVTAVTRAVDAVVPAGSSQIETARAIQSYLRGQRFTYSLQVPRPGPQDRDPLTSFLRTRTGYCVQFATAMVMMARERGIPARMAIGFLPGRLESNGSWTVRGVDAHAWPELYFPTVGWLRFEPTPSGRSGAAPGYSTAPLGGPANTATNTATAGASSSATTSPRTFDQQQDSQGALAGNRAAPLRLWDTLRTMPRWAWLLILVALGGLASMALPVAAALRRRGATAAAATDAERVEAHWQAMLRQLDDLGLHPPVGSTPRQAGRFVSVSAHLAAEDVGTLRSVVDSVERARYAVPGTPVGDVATTTRQVVLAVGRTRTRGTRVRALLLPTDGFAHVKAVVRGSLAAPRAAVARLTELVRRDAG